MTTWLLMKLLKSKSVLEFQSGMVGSWTTMGSNSIAFWSKFPYVSKPYMGLLKSSESSIIIGFDAQFVRESEDGSKAPVSIKSGIIIGVSCFTGGIIWDCLGNGLCMGGVGGAALRAKGSLKVIDLAVVGVPPFEDDEGVWAWSDSELMDDRRRV